MIRENSLTIKVAHTVIIFILCTSLLLMMLLIVSYDAAAFVFAVNSFVDVIDASPGDGVCETTTPGECTLRAAIMEANALVGADQITLPPGSYNLTLLGSGENLGAIGDLDITDDLVLSGSDPLTTVIAGAGGWDDRILEIRGSGTNVQVEGVTVSDGAGDPIGGGILNRGQLRLTGVVVENNQATDSGGGIFNLESLWLENITIQFNSASENGGGIFNQGVLVVQDGYFLSNHALNESGGGLYNTAGADASITTTSFVSNSASVWGGGVFNTGPDTTLDLDSVDFEQNSAQLGGAISNERGPVVYRSGFARLNQADRGGAIWVGAAFLLDSVDVTQNNSNDLGAGIYVEGVAADGSLNVVMSEITDNDGIGVYNAAGSVEVTSSDISANSQTGLFSFASSPPLVSVSLINTTIDSNQSAGVECINTDLTIQGGTISANQFSGVWGNGCEMSLTNVDIINNTTSGDGGGIMSANYAPVVDGGVIQGNQAAGRGGGVYYWGLSGREMQLSGTLLEDNEALSGGGIYVDAATATLDNVTLRDNRALEDGGGIYVDENNDATLKAFNYTDIEYNISDSDGDNSGIGGGIFNKGSVNLQQTYVWDNQDVGIYNEGVSLTTWGCQVINNTGFAGIYTFSPSPPLLPVTLSETSIIGNEGYGYYGINGDLDFNKGQIYDNGNSGVFVMTSLRMTKSTVRGNASSTEGGGLYLANIISATIEDSTINDNTANGSGGGIYYWGLTGGELSLTNVTLSANAADGDGGAIIVDSPPASTLNLTNVTITGSRADADGDGSGEGDVIYNNGTVNSVNAILEGDGSGPN